MDESAIRWGIVLGILSLVFKYFIPAFIARFSKKGEKLWELLCKEAFPEFLTFFVDIFMIALGFVLPRYYMSDKIVRSLSQTDDEYIHALEIVVDKNDFLKVLIPIAIVFLIFAIIIARYVKNVHDEVGSRAREWMPLMIFGYTISFTMLTLTLIYGV